MASGSGVFRKGYDRSGGCGTSEQKTATGRHVASGYEGDSFCHQQPLDGCAVSWDIGQICSCTHYPSVHPSIHPLFHPSVCLPTIPSVIIYQLMLLTIPRSHPSRVLPSAQSSIHPSTITPSHHPSIHPPRNPSTHPSCPYSMVTMVISTNKRSQGRGLVQKTQNSDFLHLLVTTLHHPVYTSF